MKKQQAEILLLKRASSIIYLGMNCSYASKPGHLFFTAYVSMSMWLFSWAYWQTRLFQGQFFERKYSRQASWPFMAAVAQWRASTSHPFSTQYFNMSRLPLHAAPSSSFCSLTLLSSWWRFLLLSRAIKKTWFHFFYVYKLYAFYSSRTYVAVNGENQEITRV